MKVKVEKVTETKNGQFLHKLISNNEVNLGDVLGDMSQKQTYYVFTNKRVEPGTEFELDIENNPNVEIVEKERTFKDADGNEMTATLKYIFPKKG